VDALLNSKARTGLAGFVNVSRHRHNLLVNGLGAFLFGHRKILRSRIPAVNECRLEALIHTRCSEALFRRLLSLASRSLARRLLREREALRLFPASCAFLSVVSAVTVSHNLLPSPACRAAAIRRRILRRRQVVR